MSFLTILRRYAETQPEKLPASILFKHTGRSITIFDAHPKSIFHFLVLPRIKEPLTASDLGSLRSLLQGDKDQAQHVLRGLKDDSEVIKKDIEEEMEKRFGFKWGVWVGFHGAPSMDHLHLHVLSADLCSEKMKNKKHYNSFHPKHGFFIDIDEVLSWFDEEPSYYAMKSQVNPKDYEPILKENLVCFKCGADMKNIPILKVHLQDEWDRLRKLESKKSLKKRKQEDPDPNENQCEMQSKKLKSDTS